MFIVTIGKEKETVAEITAHELALGKLGKTKLNLRFLNFEAILCTGLRIFLYI